MLASCFRRVTFLDLEVALSLSLTNLLNSALRASSFSLGAIGIGFTCEDEGVLSKS